MSEAFIHPLADVQAAEVGAGAMVGAGSVVTRDVPAGELWLGNPARKRGRAPRADECGSAETEA